MAQHTETPLPGPEWHVFVTVDVSDGLVEGLLAAGLAAEPFSPEQAANVLAEAQGSCVIFWQGPAAGIAAALRMGGDPAPVASAWLERAQALAALVRGNRRRIVLAEAGLLTMRGTAAGRERLRVRTGLAQLSDPISEGTGGGADLPHLLAELIVPEIAPLRACIEELSAASLLAEPHRHGIAELSAVAADFARPLDLAEELKQSRQILADLSAEQQLLRQHLLEVDTERAAVTTQNAMHITRLEETLADLAEMRHRMEESEQRVAELMVAGQKERDETALLHAVMTEERRAAAQARAEIAALQETLALRDKALQETRTEIENLSRTGKSQVGTIAMQGEEISLLQEQLGLQVAEMQLRFETQERRIATQTAEYRTQMQEAERGLARALADLRGEAKARLEAIAKGEALASEVAALREEVAARSADVAGLEAGLEQVRVAADQERTALNDRIARITQQTARESAQQVARLAEQRTALEAARQKILWLEGDRIALLRQAENIFSSTSWKMTGPLRKARTLIRSPEKPRDPSDRGGEE